MLGIGVGIRRSHGGFDADAQAFFNSVGDIPEFQKIAINKRVKAFKANGTWTGLKACLVAPATMNQFDGIRDLRSNTVTAQYMTGTPMVAVSDLTNHEPRALVSGAGFIFSNMDGQQGTVRLNLNPNGNLTLNDNCWGMICQDETAALAGFNGGSFGSATASMIFQKRDASNFLYADAHNTTVNQGRARQSSATGDGGNHMFNRRTSTDFKIYRNGTQIADSTGGGGTLNNTSFYINGHSANVTTVRNETCGAFCIYGSSLTPTVLAQEDADWQTFMADMNRTGTYDRNIVWSGNSHSVLFYGEMFRKMLYDFSDEQWFWRLAARHGKTTPQITADLASEVFPYLNAGNGTNYVFLWEATNDIGGGSDGATAYANYVAYKDAVKTYCSSNSITVKVIGVSALAREYPGNDNMVLYTDIFNTTLRDDWQADGFDGHIEINNPELWAYRADFGSDATYITHIRTLTANTGWYDSGQVHLQQDAYIYLVNNFFTPWIENN